MAAIYPFSDRMSSTIKSSSQGERVKTLLTSNGRSSTLFFRLTLLNLLAFALLFAAWWEGFVATVLAADQTHLSVLIFFVFVVGLIISFWRAIQINREIDQFCAADKQALTVDVSNAGSHGYTASMTPPGSMGALRLRLTHRIASVRHIANVLVLLGLIGTVLGFIIALSGVNPESAGDIEGIAPMVSTLIQGMSTALYTTLIGSILNVWLSANYQILASGTVELMSRWIDASEQAEHTATGASNA